MKLILLTLLLATIDVVAFPLFCGVAIFYYLGKAVRAIDFGVYPVYE